MTRRLLVTYLSLTAFVLVVLAIPLGITFSRHERRALISDVQRDALVIATLVEDALERGKPAELAPSIGGYASRTGARVIVTDAGGIGLADTDPPAPGQRDFSTRPEIIAALSGDIASGVRTSSTLGEDLLYVAVPVASGGTVYGAVRITYPTGALQSRILRAWLTIALVSLVALVAAAGLGWRFARSVTGPVRALEDAAGDLAAGNLAARAPDHSGPPEVRALAARFNETAARLDELVRSQQAFVADASHQLRTPLTALRLRLENLAGSLPADNRADIDAAIGETARLSRIVDGLLAVARTEGTRPERRTVDVAGILRERVDAWRPLAEEHNVALRIDATGDGRALDVPGHLEQILDNLLANALEVAPSGSAITLRALARDDVVEVHVIDEGPGMTAEQRDAAFDRFWRANGGRGSGLGLAIVRQLAVASGGDAELRPADGSGLDAVVRLPAAAPRLRTG